MQIWIPLEKLHTWTSFHYYYMKVYTLYDCPLGQNQYTILFTVYECLLI
jgi:hypothetical protein